MNNCSFCGTDIQPGTGIIFVKRTGKRFDFCSRKCEKNLMKLNRNPRYFKWTQEYWKEKGFQQEKAGKTETAKKEEKTEKKAVKRKRKK